MNPSEGTDNAADKSEDTESSFNINGASDVSTVLGIVQDNDPPQNTETNKTDTYTDDEYVILLDYLSIAQIHRPKVEKFDPTYFKSCDKESLATEGLRNSYMLDRIVQYRKDDMLSDLEIFESFQQDFKGWNVDDFSIVTHGARKALRDALRYRGVYTGTYVGGKISIQFAHLVTLENLLPWDIQDLHYKFDSFYYIFQETCRREGIAPGQIPESLTSQIDQHAKGERKPEHQIKPVITSFAVSTASDNDEHKQITAQNRHKSKESHEKPRVRNEIEAPVPMVYPELSVKRDPISRNTLPDQSFRNISTVPNTHTSKDIYPEIDLNKMPFIKDNLELFDLGPPEPLTNKQKAIITRGWCKMDYFSGDMYEPLDLQIQRYTKKCTEGGLCPSQFAVHFQSMLTGKASVHSDIHFKPHWRFVDQYVCLKLRFENANHMRLYLRCWNKMSFSTFMQLPRNKGKTNFQNLEAFLDKMELYQRALGPRYQSEQIFVDQLKKAIGNIFEFKGIQSKNPTTRYALINDLEEIALMLDEQSTYRRCQFRIEELSPSYK